MNRSNKYLLQAYGDCGYTGPFSLKLVELLKGDKLKVIVNKGNCKWSNQYRLLDSSNLIPLDLIVKKIERVCVTPNTYEYRYSSGRTFDSGVESIFIASKPTIILVEVTTFMGYGPNPGTPQVIISPFFVQIN